MKPALTPEEWTPALDMVRMPFVYDIIFGIGKTEGEYRHAHAAVALAGQPFGFTREDVTAVREMARLVAHIDSDPESQVYAGCPAVDSAELDSLAARIEALLPPEPK